MLTQHIALVPESYGINQSELARVSAALQKQITRDVAPRWNVQATVDAFPRLEDVPGGYWPIVLTARAIGTRQGIHLDHNGQPYARIALSPLWSLQASRVCIELLTNPFGLPTVSIRSPRADQGPAELLVEACAPCQDARYGYLLNGVLVSDFCTPAYFGAPTVTERYSFAGSIDAPFQVLPGGHITFRDVVTDRWWRKSYLDDCEVEAELNVSGGRPRLGMPRVDPPRALSTGSVLPALLIDTARAEHEVTQAGQAAALRLRQELERQDDDSDAHDISIGMLVEAAPASTPLPPTRAGTPSSPPPLPKQAATSEQTPAESHPTHAAAHAQIAATATSPTAVSAHSVSTPAMSTPAASHPSDGNRSTWRVGAWVAASTIAAVGLFSAGLVLRDVMLRPRPVTTPPAYATAPARTAPTTAPAPVPVATQDASNTRAVLDPVAEAARDAARERQRQRREAARVAAAASDGTASTTEPSVTQARAPVSIDPLDALLNTRE